MLTMKDLEVYKDTLKEKNRATKPVERPLKASPSIARIAKPPAGKPNEEPLRERKPLSVVCKAPNSKQAEPSVRIKHAIHKGPTLSKIHAPEDEHLVKASELRSDPLKPPKEIASSVKHSELKTDDKAGRKFKEPSTHSAYGPHQKNPSKAGPKGSPVPGTTISLCIECTRAASEGAVCFIGNDGRVSACTTRSAVRLCKNLNCAANDPDYVAAMANAPKKYLVSKRHLLKAQFGPISKGGHSKSPHLDCIESQLGPLIDGLSPSNDNLSTPNGDLIPSNDDMNSSNGTCSPVKGDLRPVNEGTVSSKGDLGLSNGDVSLTAGNATAQNQVGLGCCRAERNEAANNEHLEFSFHEEAVVEYCSPKLLVNESPKVPIQAHLDDNGSCDAKLLTDHGSSQFNLPRELDDEERDGSSMCLLEKDSHLEGKPMQNDGDNISPTAARHEEDEDHSGNDAARHEEDEDHSGNDAARHEEEDDHSGVGGNAAHTAVNNMNFMEDNLVESFESMECTSISRGHKELASVINGNGSLGKGYHLRRRRSLGVVEDPNPERVTLRKQRTRERKQAEEWMLNHAIEGVVQKLAPTGEAKVKILVEAFESIISHTDVEAIGPHIGEALPSSNQEEHTLA